MGRAAQLSRGARAPIISRSAQRRTQLRAKRGRDKIRGRVDRLDRISGNRVAIVDYKTGRPRSQEDADDSLQLSLYALAAREQWKLQPEQLIFHNLETNTCVVTTRTPAQLDEAARLVEEVAQRIAAGEFDAKTGFHCNWCAFRNLCPAQEKTLYNIEPAPQTIAAKVN